MGPTESCEPLKEEKLEEESMMGKEERKDEEDRESASKSEELMCHCWF